MLVREISLERSQGFRISPGIHQAISESGLVRPIIAESHRLLVPSHGLAVAAGLEKAACEFCLEVRPILVRGVELDRQLECGDGLCPQSGSEQRVSEGIRTRG